MKYKEVNKKTKPAWKPRTIELTFESKNEFDVFSSLCNCAPVADALETLGFALPNYEFMEKMGGYIHGTEAIIKAITQADYMKTRVRK